MPEDVRWEIPEPPGIVSATAMVRESAAAYGSGAGGAG
jgi:hypothetical protein